MPVTGEQLEPVGVLTLLCCVSTIEPQCSFVSSTFYQDFFSNHVSGHRRPVMLFLYCGQWALELFFLLQYLECPQGKNWHRHGASSVATFFILFFQYIHVSALFLQSMRS